MKRETVDEKFLRQHFVESEEVAEQLQLIGALCADSGVAIEIELDNDGDLSIQRQDTSAPISNLEGVVKTASGLRRVSLIDCVEQLLGGDGGNDLLSSHDLFPNVPDADPDDEPWYRVQICVDAKGRCDITFSNTMTAEPEEPTHSVTINPARGECGTDVEEEADWLIRLLTRCGVEQVDAKAYGGGDSTDGICADIYMAEGRGLSSSTNAKVEERIVTTLETLYDSYLGWNYWDSEGGSMTATIDVQNREIQMSVYLCSNVTQCTTVTKDLCIPFTKKPKRVARSAA